MVLYYCLLMDGRLMSHYSESHNFLVPFGSLSAVCVSHGRKWGRKRRSEQFWSPACEGPSFLFEPALARRRSSLNILHHTTGGPPTPSMCSTMLI